MRILRVRKCVRASEYRIHPKEAFGAPIVDREMFCRGLRIAQSPHLVETKLFSTDIMMYKSIDIGKLF